MAIKMILYNNIRNISIDNISHVISSKWNKGGEELQYLKFELWSKTLCDTAVECCI